MSVDISYDAVEVEQEDTIYQDDFHSESEISNSASQESNVHNGNKGREMKNKKDSKRERTSSSRSTRELQKEKLSNQEKRKINRKVMSANDKAVIHKNHSEEATRNQRNSAQRKARLHRNSSSTSVVNRSRREGSRKSVHWYSSDESSEESSSTDSEQDKNWSRELRPELTAEYWDIHKLVRFLKVGNPTVTLIALCALDDFNLYQEMTQLSVLDLGGVAILLNVLNTNHTSCMIGSLKLLLRLTKSRKVNDEIYRLKGAQQIIDSLGSRSLEIQSLAAGTLANFASFRKAYHAVNRCRGISILVTTLKSLRNKRSLRIRVKQQNDNTETLYKNVCDALWSCSRWPKNVNAIREAGAVPIISSLLKDGSTDVILCCVGIIQECSNDSTFRDDIRREGIIEDIVRLLKIGDNELKTLCANAIFKCGDDVETQHLVLKHKGLEPMNQVLTSTNQCTDEKLLCAVAGALWKCASYKENIERLESLGTIFDLVKHLKSGHQLEVEANILGALSSFAYCRRNVMKLYEQGVLHIAINKLNDTDPNILVNSTRILALCAKENTPRREILTSDGVRLLWSLLKSSNHKVVASAAYGIAMCVSNAEESAETVRSLVGGLELVTKLLRSNRREVLISVCQMVINIGQDRENMSIMTDYDIVPLLISLVYTDDEQLHQYVAEAIATSCNLEKNITALTPTIVPLSDGLRTFKSMDVHKNTALALEKLSHNSNNCFTIHKCGAVKHLMRMMASENHDVQEAAARCIKNIRTNAVNSHKNTSGRDHL